MSGEIKIGEVLDERFQVQELIEHGGMATVFKAVDRQTHQTVALKVPHAEFEGTRGNSSRFAREAAIIGRLDHPGILKIIPISNKSRPYIAMQYLEGETLAEVLKRKRPLPVCEALQMSSRLCEILEYVHRHGVVHRDLKPGNIMLSRDGSVHIIDFGIAKGPGMFSPKFGTLDYMAPEQMRGDKVDARADIYSLGMIVYEMVTGIRPDDKQVRPPRDFNDALSEEVEEIILHAMAPRPSDRYASAAAMKAELDSPESVHVTGTYRNPRRPSAWPKRLRLAGVVLAIAAIPFILFYVFFLIFQKQLAR